MPWERRRYRENKVWVDVDDHGRPILDDRGLAAVRYKPQDDRTYTVRPEDVLPLEGEAEAEETGAAAEADAGGEGLLVIYTDGASSGNPGPAGLGAVLEWRGHRREIQQFLGPATNNEAELRAVLVGLEAVRRPSLRVEVRTDSEYVIGVLARGHRVKANVELVRAIHREMARFADLGFVKVPAHAGVPGNERADRLARDAIARGTA